MTYVKKINGDWQPQEFPQARVNDVVDFPGNIQKLVEDGMVMPCEEDGTEISAYESVGVITARERAEFEAWVEMKKQERLKQTLEKEHDSLLAEASKLKAEKAEAEKPKKKEKTPEEKKAFADKMTAARKAKKAAKNG